ncbi:hypothetical protein CA54_22930 [Symmachiella macrocystis]|uniref:Uncharacterized protein n=1 Tax=Symmachiella macrocystis TaxID=2527985 RepID=A0A5C6BN10_9PLAN|nr:hypothetical protein [Symmachiella macrocystis]TWU13458.1 hypothetical protein CA54_22930 [Symmachiella macrocystis]
MSKLAGLARLAQHKCVVQSTATHLWRLCKILSDDRFRHQQYTNAPPAAAYQLLRADPGPELGCEEFRLRMRAVGDQLRAAGVSSLYLVHGTFVGGDAAGLWLELSRLLPAYGETLRQLNKQWVDATVGEHGNFTAQFAQKLEESLNIGSERPIPVRLFHWSSENHHIGRADAAVRLFDELYNRKDQGRILLWGHSHAGNVFALLSQLLAADNATIDLFFRTAQVYFRNPMTRRIDLPWWPNVWRRLKDPHRALAAEQCDFVTFGTPIRYAWAPNGNARLLHFINHRLREGLPEYLCPFPPTLDDFLHAAVGDYIQQLGIAGTNVPPGVLAWRNFLADRRLNRLLQHNLRLRDLQERLKLGMRVPEQGVSLLCDYGLPNSNIARHHAGHAVYTQLQWLLFHAEQTCLHLYKRNLNASPPTD